MASRATAARRDAPAGPPARAQGSCDANNFDTDEKLWPFIGRGGAYSEEKLWLGRRRRRRRCPEQAFLFAQTCKDHLDDVQDISQTTCYWIDSPDHLGTGYTVSGSSSCAAGALAPVTRQAEQVIAPPPSHLV